MSIKLMSAIFEAEFRDLEYIKKGEKRNAKASTVKLVLLAIADHANDDGEAYPGYIHLQRKTALSAQGLADTLDALEYNGLLLIREKSSRIGTNSYRLNLRSFPAIARAMPDIVKPLESLDSSGLSTPSQVALVEPSVKPSVKPVYIDPVAKKLSDSKFPINPNSTVIIQGWKEDFPNQDAVIIRAIDEALAHNARSLAYVDRVLIGWKANGIPPTREEQIQTAKKGKPVYANPTSHTAVKQVTEEQLSIARQVLAMRAGAD